MHPSTPSVRDLLTVYATQHAALAELRARKEQALPPEIQSAIAQNDEDFAASLAEAQALVDQTAAQIKALVVVAGVSVKGSLWQAVYMRGRISWDRQGLEEYASAVPEILKFRIEGQPSVSLRRRGVNQGKHPLGEAYVATR